MTDEIPTMIATPTGDIEASKTTVPTSRTFRNAWRLEGDVIAVDMDLAREIAREKIRMARAPVLASLDVQYMRATEVGTDAGPIIESKQWLRDITADPRIDAAEDPAALETALNSIVQEMSA
jgi:hypothetical protein